MTPRNLQEEIKDSLVFGEDLDDVLWMIDILAFERLLYKGIELTEQVYKFAGKVLCVIFDPIKPPEYRTSAEALRQVYQDISRDRGLRIAFRESIQEPVLEVETAQEAYGLGIETMFAFQQGPSLELS